MSLTGKLMSAVPLTLFLAACGGDVVEPGDELTEREAIALLRGAVSVLWTDDMPIHASDDSVVVRCQRGGRATAVGKLPDEEFKGDTVRLTIDYLIVPSGCEVTRDGSEFTLDGNPSFRYEFFIEYIGSTGEYDITGRISGVVRWQLEARSGGCTMDVRLMDPEPVGETVTGFYGGKVCGYEVEVDAEGLVPPLDD